MVKQSRKTTVLCSLATACCYPFGTLADEAQPSFDCAKAQSSAEELVCADDALAALDRRMAERFSAALQSAGSMDAGAEEATNTLRATQRGWIKGRDDCWKADDLRDCVTSAYLTRENELVTQWFLQDPTSVVSYFCEGNRANEITVYFFDTELPSVRLERGDSIDSGSQTRTASGARFDASFGRFIWIKGDKATVVWTEGDEMSCEVAG